MSIKAILFDLDGTLFDSETHYVNGTIDWLSRYNVHITFEEASKIIGKTMEETYEIIQKASGLDLDTIIKTNTKYFKEENSIDFNKLLFKDVRPCFSKLHKQGYKICICSMSPANYIKQFIDECNLNEYVDFYISGYDCKHTKPDPEIYNITIDKLKLDRKEVLIVEDATSGLEAGRRSGAYVIGRNDAKFGINQDDAMYVFEDLEELDTIIEEINHGKYD